MQPPKFEDYDPFKPERKRRPLLKAFLAVTLLTAGAAGYGVYRLTRTTPLAPTLLPAETPAFVSFTPGMAALGGLPVLKRAYPQAFSWQGYQDFRTRCERDLGLNFEKDVAPWLGIEMDVAFSQAEAAGATLFFASHNDDRARAALAKVRMARQRKGEEASPETYEGVAYDNYPGGQALGVVGGFVVWASSEAAFRGIVDRAQHRNAETLAADPEYKALLGQLPGDAVARFFVSAGGAKGAMPTSKDARRALEAYRGLAGALVLQRDQVALETVAHLDPTQLPEPFNSHLADLRQSVDPHLMDALPADAISAMSFRLPPGTPEVVKGLMADTLRGYPSIQQAQQQAGVDLNRDLAAWMEGELAVAIVPGKIDRGTPIELALVMKPKDLQAAETGLGHLREAWTRKMSPTLPGGQVLPSLYAFREQSRGGIPWQVLHDSAQNRDLGGYAVSGDKLFLAYGPTTLEHGGKPGAPLTADPAFKAAIGSLPRPNGGVMFLDVAGSYALAMPYLGDKAGELEAALRPVTAIAAAGTPGISDDGFMRSTLVARVEEPTPAK
ncbi:MAG: hypothetical protein JWM80_5263 [Cyanobacteria bacterium RYN_339]|nr:hypothetical protein [Cyanobacteria bacterium RYN_339]